MTTSITDYLPANVATASTTTNTRGDSDLSQEDFLELMVAQLQNQDPTNPADTTEFTSQIAEFSTVEGISDLNKSFSEFADVFSGSQTMDAVNLVGRSVMTESNMGYLNEGGDINASIDMPSYASAVTVYVQDEFGALVNQATFGPAAEGYQEFNWDGLNMDGDEMAEGRYRISAEAFIDGQTQSIPVYAHNQVESVVLNNALGSYELRLADGSAAELSEVLGIFQ